MMLDKNPVGRPRKEIERKHLEELCNMWCTINEICNFFNVTEPTLDTRVKSFGYDNFLGFYKEHSADGKMSLRRAQLSKALYDDAQGNVTMQLWLGKQHLGQTEKVDPATIVEDKITPSKDLSAEIKERKELIALEKELIALKNITINGS